MSFFCERIIRSTLLGKTCISLAFIFVSSTTALAKEETVLKVLSDRTESNVKPLLEEFTKKTGIKVSAAYIDQGLLARMENRPDEADLVISKDADLIEIAKTKKLLTSFKSSLINSALPTDFVDKDNNYFVDAYRARVIFFSKARVKPSELSSYEDLTNPKWLKKICIRSGLHDYNIAFFSQMLSAYGFEKTKAIMQGIHKNLAREPKGNDREQAKGIFENKCDIAIMNTYYHPIMQSTPEQKPWADATVIFYPDQKAQGTFIMRSALALTTATRNIPEATQLMEYFISEEAQTMMMNATFQFPVNKAVKWNDKLTKLAGIQPDIKNGAFKINFVSLAEMAKNREIIVKLLNEINFDKL